MTSSDVFFSGVGSPAAVSIQLLQHDYIFQINSNFLKQEGKTHATSWNCHLKLFALILLIYQQYLKGLFYLVDDWKVQILVKMFIFDCYTKLIKQFALLQKFKFLTKFEAYFLFHRLPNIKFMTAFQNGRTDVTNG